MPLSGKGGSGFQYIPVHRYIIHRINGYKQDREKQVHHSIKLADVGTALAGIYALKCGCWVRLNSFSGPHGIMFPPSHSTLIELSRSKTLILPDPLELYRILPTYARHANIPV